MILLVKFHQYIKGKVPLIQTDKKLEETFELIESIKYCKRKPILITWSIAHLM